MRSAISNNPPRPPLAQQAAQQAAQQEWRSWSGGNDGNRYSPLAQINRANVKQLQVAWQFQSSDADPRGRTAIQCTPILVNGVLYATTPTLDAIALDAATGKLLWRFSPPASRFRGVMFYQHQSEARIFSAAGAQLLAIDAKTGQAVSTFGENGAVNLAKHLDRDPPGAINGTSSPAVIHKQLIIIASSVGEGPRMAALGHIRAYDVRTGQRRWIFHTIPHPGEFGYDTWPKDAWKTSGATNAWGGISVDDKKGVVFVSLSSPSYAYYGADRIGDNLFGNSIVALDANTGQRLWHYDLPVNANRFTWKGKPALAQITKQGYVLVLDRANGKPSFRSRNAPSPPPISPAKSPPAPNPSPSSPRPSPPSATNPATSPRN
jgi:quinoprotein glucose dehydrogenase